MHFNKHKKIYNLIIPLLREPLSQDTEYLF